MSQDVGAQTHWKNRSHTRSGLARFFQCVCAQEVAADGRFLFRFSGLKRAFSPPKKMLFIFAVS
jgi:hypothetical protein